MTDTPKKRKPRVYPKPAHPKPVPGKVRDHIEAEKKSGKKSTPMVPKTERKIGQPNQRIRSLVKHIADGKTLADAAEAAGIPRIPSEKSGDNNIARDILKRPYVKEMVAAERAETARDHKITRKMVIEGLKEAIDMSRTLAEPAVMIAGWKEIAKMCGFYEAVKVKVDLTTGGAELSQRIIGMSDADLLRLACGETPEDDIIDGEFEEV